MSPDPLTTLIVYQPWGLGTIKRAVKKGPSKPRRPRNQGCGTIPSRRSILHLIPPEGHTSTSSVASSLFREHPVPAGNARRSSKGLPQSKHGQHKCKGSRRSESSVQTLLEGQHDSHRLVISVVFFCRYKASCVVERGVALEIKKGCKEWSPPRSCGPSSARGRAGWSG